MEKIFKKSLALMVSAALCLTAFVGCLTVNAETAGSATVTVGEVTAKTTDTTVEVPVTIAVGEDATTGIAAAIFDITVDSTKFDFSKRHWDSCLTYDTAQNIHVSTITNGDFIQPLNGTNNTYRFLVEGLAEGSTDENTLGTFTSATFKLTFDVIDNTAGETAITFNTDTMVPQACNAGTLDLQGNYTGAEEPFSVATVAGKITVQAAVTEPVLDESLKNVLSSLNIAISNKFGFEFGLYFNNVAYDDFELVVSKQELDSNFTYTGNIIQKTFNSTSEYTADSLPDYNLFYFIYDDISIYEMSLDISYTLYIIKDGARVSYYTWDATTLSQKANDYYTNNFSNAVKRSMAVDILNLGTAAQVYFADKGADGNPLKTFSLPNANVDSQYATDYGTLTEIDGVRDSAFTYVSLQLGAAPSLWYEIYLPSYKTPADLTFTATYETLVNGGSTITRSVNGTELTQDELANSAYGLYYFGFDQVALYDGNKLITMTVTAADGSSWTHQYSVESLISTRINEVGLAGDVFRAVAAFNASARNFWPDF